MGAKLFSPRAATAGAIPAIPAATTHRPEGRFREAAALLLFAAAAFTTLALASVRLDPLDAEAHGANWVGPVGAGLATILVQGFGLVAWLLPIEISICAAPLFRGRPVGPLGLRLAGDLVLAIVLSSLVQVAAPEAIAFGGAPAAGNVGLLFGELMRQAFSTLGSFLVGFTSAGLIVIGRSGFSFIAWCQRTLELLRALAFRLSAGWRRLAGAWGTARELRAEQLRAERAANEPRIETHEDEATVLFAPDDDTDWIPLDETGAPPIAISQALSRSSSPCLIGSTPKFSIELPEDGEPAPLAPEALGAPVPQAAQLDAPVELALTATPVEPLAAPAAEVVPAASAPVVTSSVPLEGSAGASAERAEPVIVDTKPALEVERPRTPPPAVRRRGAFQLPSTDLLNVAGPSTTELDRSKIFEHATRLEKTLADYGVVAKVEEIHPGPTVTTYEVACEAGTKVSRVAGLADDLAMGLSRKVRIIAPIPGKSRIGFELPNDERTAVNLRELIEDQRFEKLADKAPLPVVLGRDIVGAPFYADLASMPHVIVAGATGAGKSVGLNVMLSSLLFKRSPEDLRLLMIDPKVVELAPFDGIPHMLLPVVTDMKQAATALRWAVDEMERRYQLFADAGTKNITTYNAWVNRVVAGEAPAPKVTEVDAVGADGLVVTVPAAKEGSDGSVLPGKLPYIVIVVDEFADLMMQQGKEVEASVARLAQKARAAGMHVVLATQRPSVDVITGMIKANFPSRIGFRVAQKVDSRTILDEQGAELLLGRGDMLVKLNGATDTQRVQCPFVSEEEVSSLTDHLRAQGAPSTTRPFCSGPTTNPRTRRARTSWTRVSTRPCESWRKRSAARPRGSSAR